MTIYDYWNIYELFSIRKSCIYIKAHYVDILNKHLSTDHRQVWSRFSDPPAFKLSFSLMNSAQIQTYIVRMSL